MLRDLTKDRTAQVEVDWGPKVTPGGGQILAGTLGEDKPEPAISAGHLVAHWGPKGPGVASCPPKRSRWRPATLMVSRAPPGEGT